MSAIDGRKTLYYSALSYSIVFKNPAITLL